MTPLKMLTGADAHAEIRRLYFGATKATIEADLAKALDLLKAMPDEETRERATVYMEGLAQMRTDWTRERATRPAAPKRKPAGTRATAGTAGEPSGRPKAVGTRAPRKSAAASRGAAKTPRTR